MSYAYRAGYDTLRGRLRACMRRREHQKRGPPHDHINEFAELCSCETPQLLLPMQSAGPASFQERTSDARLTHVHLCLTLCCIKRRHAFCVFFGHLFVF